MSIKYTVTTTTPAVRITTYTVMANTQDEAWSLVQQGKFMSVHDEYEDDNASCATYSDQVEAVRQKKEQP